MDLQQDYKKIVDDVLKTEFAVPSSKISNDYDNTIILFSKLHRQQVFINRPWKVVKHPDVAIPTNLQSGYGALLKALETGIDITKFMTTHIDDAEFDDVMLDCDGVYHFHLGEKPHPTKPTFNERTDERVFAYLDIYGNSAYVIDLYKHGAERNLIKDRIKKLWKQYPNAIKRNVQEGVLDVDYSDEDIYKMRKAQINAGIQLDKNHFFISEKGLTLAGTAIEDTMYLTKTVSCFRKIEKDISSVKEVDNATLFNDFGKLCVRITGSKGEEIQTLSPTIYF